MTNPYLPEISVPTILTSKREEPVKNDLQSHTEIVFRKEASVNLGTEDEDEEEEDDCKIV